jgi:PAS domain S-box-containing protein
VLFPRSHAWAAERVDAVLRGERGVRTLRGKGKNAWRLRIAPFETGGARAALLTAARGSGSAREREDPYRTVSRVIPDIVLRVRHDGTLVEDPELSSHAQAKATPQMLATIARQSAMYVARAIKTRSLKSAMCRVAVSGRVCDFETRIVPYGAHEALIIARDISDQTRTEEELQLFLGITLTTSDAVDLRSSLEVVMRLVCESTGWVVGQAWVPRSGGVLHCTAAWLAHPSPALRAFRAASENLTFDARAGHACLPGSVFARARATWMRDVTLDPSYRRGAVARDAGLMTGFAVPVMADTEVVAVLEFYAFEPRDEDERLLTTVSAVAEQLGALMKRKRAEEAFRLLETAIQQMSESIVITSAVPEAPIIEFVSPAFSRMTGYVPDEVVGMTLDVLSGAGTDRALVASVRRSLLDGAIVEMETVNYRKDGSEVPIEWRVAPVRDNHGRVSHFVAIQRDITQRKLAEKARMDLQRALETAASQWRMTFDAIESPIMLVDREGRLLRMNRAAQALSGHEFKTHLTRTLDTIGDGEPWRKGAQVALATLRTRGPVSSQVKDETHGKTWDFSATLLEEADDDKVILVVRDITRLVDLQESLRRSETMSVMGALVAGVAHEVRNPLHAITVTLDAFEARFQIAEEHKRHINVLRGEVKRLSALMHDLLEYGKPTAPEFTEGSMREVVLQAMTMCTAHATDLGVRLVCNVPGELPNLKIDKPRLVQVFQNLLENAIQHSKDGGAVTVTAGEVRYDDERWIECAVADEGPGFRDADLPQVFKPFFTRRRGGTGLGLSIVLRIVDEHGGTAWAANRPHQEGGGGVVTVRLPIRTS